MLPVTLLRRTVNFVRPGVSCKLFSTGADEKVYHFKRVYHTEDGGSKFGTVELPLDAHTGQIGSLSRLFPGEGVIFRETPGNYDYDWHNAPKEQFIVNLDAAVDVTTTDGRTLRMEAGEVFYVQDTEGKGHYSQSVAGKTRKSIFMPVPAESLAGMLKDEWVGAEEEHK